MVLNFIDEQIETVLQGCDYNDIEKESFGRTAGKKLNQLFIGNELALVLIGEPVVVVIDHL